MEIKLTIQERLRDLRAERGLTLEQLANDTHISRSSLSSYESNEFKDISPFAIVTLAQFYGVSTDYLLGLSENKKHSDVDITSLHLNDEVLDLLRSGKINNRLLGEIILHKDFKRFLLDVEIVVDRIADSYVSSMGTFFSVIRKKFADKFHPDEDSLFLCSPQIVQPVQEPPSSMCAFSSYSPLYCKRERIPLSIRSLCQSVQFTLK